MASDHPGMLAPGRGGRLDVGPGLVVRECAGLALASLIARQGAAARAVDAALGAYGVRLPVTPRAVTGRDVTFIWAGPNQWLVEARDPPGGIESLLGGTFGDLAAICEQSDGRVILDVHGPSVRAVLAKGLPIDLHGDAFGVGDVALTAVHHVGVHLRQIGALPVYRLGIVRSYFGSFWHWLSSSAAEFGYEVVVPCDAREPAGG